MKATLEISDSLVNFAHRLLLLERLVGVVKALDIDCDEFHEDGGGVSVDVCGASVTKLHYGADYYHSDAFKIASLMHDVKGLLSELEEGEDG